MKQTNQLLSTAVQQLLTATADFFNEYLVKSEYRTHDNAIAVLTVKTPKATYVLKADLSANSATLAKKINGTERRIYKGNPVEAVVQLISSVLSDISSVLSSAILMTSVCELITSYPTDFACVLLRATKRWYYTRTLR